MIAEELASLVVLEDRQAQQEPSLELPGVDWKSNWLEAVVVFRHGVAGPVLELEILAVLEQAAVQEHLATQRAAPKLATAKLAWRTARRGYLGWWASVAEAWHHSAAHTVLSVGMSSSSSLQSISGCP